MNYILENYLTQKKCVTILFLFLILILFSGCDLFEKGLDVCQDDRCFMGLAEEAYNNDDTAQAREFCNAILDEATQQDCRDRFTQ